MTGVLHDCAGRFRAVAPRRSITLAVRAVLAAPVRPTVAPAPVAILRAGSATITPPISAQHTCQDISANSANEAGFSEA